MLLGRSVPLLVALGGACAPSSSSPAPLAVEQPAPAVAESRPTRSPRWPEPGAALSLLPVEIPEGFGKKRVLVDAGHGALGNRGAASVTCEDEQDFTLRVARDLAARLEATGAFQVRLSRSGGGPVDYRERLAAAESWKADALVSLHFDARGTAVAWQPSIGKSSCYRNDSQEGFALLWSDEAPTALKDRRLALARAIAARMAESGFLPYDGYDYQGLYEADEAQPGVFVDRHEPGRRIYLLRKARVPSVIIETHHALHFQEAARWREVRTLEAFGWAVAAALTEALR